MSVDVHGQVLAGTHIPPNLVERQNPALPQISPHVSQETVISGQGMQEYGQPPAPHLVQRTSSIDALALPVSDYVLFDDTQGYVQRETSNGVEGADVFCELAESGVPRTSQNTEGKGDRDVTNVLIQSTAGYDDPRAASGLDIQDGLPSQRVPTRLNSNPLPRLRWPVRSPVPSVSPEERTRETAILRGDAFAEYSASPEDSAMQDSLEITGAPIAAGRKGSQPAAIDAMLQLKMPLMALQLGSVLSNDRKGEQQNEKRSSTFDILFSAEDADRLDEPAKRRADSEPVVALPSPPLAGFAPADYTSRLSRTSNLPSTFGHSAEAGAAASAEPSSSADAESVSTDVAAFRKKFKAWA